MSPISFVRHYGRRMLCSFGIDARRIRPGTNPFWDISRLAPDRSIVFDVGANVGQTITELRKFLVDPKIYSFEPSEQTFAELNRRHGRSNAVLNNFALGSKDESRLLHENTDSKLSSFLSAGCELWGSLRDRNIVEVRKLDTYCSENNIKTIDILKCDTQGFELEILRGSERMLHDNAISLIYLEINFSKDLYNSCPSFEEILYFLRDNRFNLYSVYDFHIVDRMAGWADALFIHEQFR